MSGHGALALRRGASLHFSYHCALFFTCIKYPYIGATLGALHLTARLGECAMGARLICLRLYNSSLLFLMV
jgi:hypothetical protein